MSPPNQLYLLIVPLLIFIPYFEKKEATLFLFLDNVRAITRSQGRSSVEPVGIRKCPAL